MSSHRTLNDLYHAYTDIGPGILADPGDGGTIAPTMWGQICEITSAGAETRTLARPNRSGIRFTVVLYSDGGNVTLTATGGLNAAGDTVAVLADAGDMLDLISVKASGTTSSWRIVENVGTVAVTSASVSSSPSDSVSDSPSESPSASESASSSPSSSSS